MISVADKLATARAIVRKRAPYFSRILLKLKPVENPAVDTMATSENGTLHYSAAFVEAECLESLAASIAHELWHLLDEHHARCGQRDMMQWNIAGDLAINCPLRDMGFQLFEGALYPKGYGFPENLTAEDYFERLTKQAEQKKQEEAQGQGEKEGDQGAPGGATPAPDADSASTAQGQSDTAQQAPGAPGQGDKPAPPARPGSGHCGRCAGRPAPGEPVDSQEDTESEAEMARARREVAESVRQHAQQGRGKVPAGLARWAEVELAPPVIPWQRRLARVVRTAVAWRPGAVDLRYTTPSRRQAGLGFGAGRAVLPAYQRPVPKVGIGLDTSGSMGTAELAASLAEVQGVLKAVGAEVSFCSCDSKVHEGAKGSVRTVKEARKLVKGGGGTSFLPIFETLAKDRCEVIIICTDGCGPAPAQAPRGMRVIWVLMGPFARKPCAWGDHIFLPQQEAR